MSHDTDAPETDTPQVPTAEAETPTEMPTETPSSKSPQQRLQERLDEIAKEIGDDNRMVVKLHPNGRPAEAIKRGEVIEFKSATLDRLREACAREVTPDLSFDQMLNTLIDNSRYHKQLAKYYKRQLKKAKTSKQSAYAQAEMLDTRNIELENTASVLLRRLHEQDQVNDNRHYQYSPADFPSSAFRHDEDEPEGAHEQCPHDEEFNMKQAVLYGLIDTAVAVALGTRAIKGVEGRGLNGLIDAAVAVAPVLLPKLASRFGVNLDWLLPSGPVAPAPTAEAAQEPATPPFLLFPNPAAGATEPIKGSYNGIWDPTTHTPNIVAMAAAEGLAIGDFWVVGRTGSTEAFGGYRWYLGQFVVYVGEAGIQDSGFMKLEPLNASKASNVAYTGN